MSGKATQRRIAHGWTISHVTMPAGERYTLIAARAAPHDELPITAFYTRGRVAVLNLTTGAEVSTRLPGVLTRDLGVMNAGTHQFQSEEDSEWWCFDKRLNAGQLPVLVKLDLAAGQSMPLQAGQRLLICSGSASLDGQDLALGDAVQTQMPGELVASSNLLALLFDRSLS